MKLLVWFLAIGWAALFVLYLFQAYEPSRFVIGAMFAFLSITNFIQATGGK